MGTRVTGRGLSSPDGPHQLLEGLIHVETQFGRGLEVGHVVGGTESRCFSSGDLVGTVKDTGIRFSYSG